VNHSEDDIIRYINKKIDDMTWKKELDTSFFPFIGEQDLFSELGALTSHEREKIRDLVCPIIHKHNFFSKVKIGTDLKGYELLDNKKYVDEYSDLFLPHKWPEPESEIEMAYPDYNNNLTNNSFAYSRNQKDQDLPGPFLTLFLIGFCIVIAILNLGEEWYEVILKIIAFLFALSFGFILYSIITNIVARSDFFLKRPIHFLLLLIFPLIIYVCIKVYFL